MSNRVLVVDDNAAFGELIQEVLRSVDIESLVLTHSGQAVTCLAREKFGAVFLDMNMPAPNGIELMLKIRSGGLNVSTPIMIITGEDEHALLGRAFEAGANFFLYRPIDRHAILRLVRATKDSIEHERRRFRRINVSCKVSIETGGTQLTGSTLDMSIGGMFVQSSSVLPLGSVAQVTVHVPSGPPLSLATRALRLSGDVHGYAIRERHPDAEQRPPGILAASDSCEAPVKFCGDCEMLDAQGTSLLAVHIPSQHFLDMR